MKKKIIQKSKICKLFFYAINIYLLFIAFTKVAITIKFKKGYI